MDVNIEHNCSILYGLELMEINRDWDLIKTNERVNVLGSM